MKRILGLLLVFMLALAGCSGQSGSSSGSGDIDSLKTMGDVFALQDVTNEQYAYDESTYWYGFEYNDVYYRVIADIPEDMSKEIWSINDDDFDATREKVKDIISSLEFKSLENLTEGIPTQEELDEWIGKTGKDLTDAGWTGFGSNLTEMEFYMNDGPYLVTVKFDGSLTETDEMDDAEIIKDLKIKSLEYQDIGDISLTTNN